MPSPSEQPSQAQDKQSTLVAGSPDAATRLGASADPAPQPGTPSEGEQPTNPDGTPVVPPYNPEDPALAEAAEAAPPFEATCPTCATTLAVYVPEPEPAEYNASKVETGFCVVCGRRWSRSELETAGTLSESQETSSEEDATGEQGDQAAGNGSADAASSSGPASTKDRDRESSKAKDKDKASSSAPDSEKDSALTPGGTPRGGPSPSSSATHTKP